MQILSIELLRFNRMALGMYENISYSPTAPEQVILGSNGSGKTSLLRQIYNLVPDGDCFGKDGGQIVNLFFGGNYYRISSIFSNKPGVHSFLRSVDQENWEELNESRLQTDQRMLVKDVFGLDQDLIDLMMGEIRLSSMDPKQRRQWMMRICSTDFDYVNGLHDQLRKRYRDFKGTVDTLSKSLLTATKDVEAITAEVAGNDSELDDLERLFSRSSEEIERLGRPKSSAHDIGLKVKGLVERIKQNANGIIGQVKSRHPHLNCVESRKVEEWKELAQSNQGELKGRQNALQERLRDISLALESVGIDNIKEPSKVYQQIEKLEEEIASLVPHRTDLGLTHEEVSLRLKSVDIAIRRVESFINDIPFVEDVEKLKRDYKVATARVEVINKTIVEIDQRVSQMSVRVEHYEHTDTVDCPDCKTKFKPGLDATLIGQYREAIVKRTAQRNELYAELGELNLTMQTFDLMATGFRQFNGVVSDHADLNLVWDVIKDNRAITRAPATVVPSLVQHKRLLETELAYTGAKERLDQLMIVKASLEGNASLLMEQGDAIESELFDINQDLEKMQRDINRFDQDIAIASKVHRLADNHTRLIEEYEKAVSELDDAILVEGLSGMRQSVTARIGHLNTLKNRFNALRQRVTVLEEEVESNKHASSVYRLLSLATSPTDGLVADIIRNFMRHFLAHMNKHIGRIWSYDLKLSEKVTPGKAFDCQFPMHVAGAEKPVSDFRFGSTGQVSMIDFAFKLVVFKLKGLNGFPLLADEFGKDFDDEHRERLVQYIKELIEDKSFSQLFMICHYSSVYSAFDNAEFVVLDDRNITKPTTYNTGVTFS